MSNLPPSDEEGAPFRLPGLPVEGMRREGSALRVARAAWRGARDVGVGGAEFLRTREPVREVVRRERPRVRAVSARA